MPTQILATSMDETSSAIAGADTAREIESVNPFDLMLGEVHSAVSEDTAWGVESANPFVLGVREFGQMMHSERLNQRLRQFSGLLLWLRCALRGGTLWRGHVTSAAH